jgi:hypothetical protein
MAVVAAFFCHIAESKLIVSERVGSSSQLNWLSLFF